MDSTLWRQHYHPDMKHDIDPSEFRSLVDYFEHYADTFSTRTVFECMDKPLTFAEVRTYAKQFAGWLQSKDIGVEKRVAIMLPNCLSYPVSMLGTLYAGATVTNLNPLYTPDELHHQLLNSEAKVIVVLENFANTVQQAIAQGDTQIEHIVIAKISDFQSPLKATLINLVLKYVRKQIPVYDLPNHVKFSDVLKQGLSHSAVDLTHDNIAYLQYTGGTTGKAKGAMLSHGNMLANVMQSFEFVKLVKTPDGEPHRMLTALPLYHIFSLTASCWIFFACGARNVLIPNPRDLKGFVKAFETVKPTFVAGVNTLFNLLMTSDAFKRLDFSALQCTLAGGMTVQENTAREWAKITGNEICQGYGLTEASPVVAVNVPLDYQFNGTIGYVAPSTEAKVVDDDGFELPVSGPGELWVRGPQVMQGYWKNDAATNDTITKDGWLRTGDVAMFDEAGRLSIVDRKKHIIIVSGFNVYPSEVEDALTQHPDIDECAVLGVPSDKTGEHVRAYIVRRAGSHIGTEEINAFARQHLTGYKSPDEYLFRDELPKTNVGKIDIKLLKAEIQQEINAAKPTN